MHALWGCCNVLIYKMVTHHLGLSNFEFLVANWVGKANAHDDTKMSQLKKRFLRYSDYMIFKMATVCLL